MYGINIENLEKAIIDNNLTKEAIALELGIDRSTFYRRLKSNRLLLVDVHKIADVLNLSKEKVVAIFFESKVA